jgi:hypothetical protein
MKNIFSTTIDNIFGKFSESENFKKKSKSKNTIEFFPSPKKVENL